MKRILAAMGAVALFAGGALAADTIDFPTKMGKVTFNHKMHQEVLKDCKACHEKGPGKIEGFGKDWAHKSCKGCHQERSKGPVTCKECHRL